MVNRTVLAGGALVGLVMLSGVAYVSLDVLEDSNKNPITSLGIPLIIGPDNNQAFVVGEVIELKASDTPPDIRISDSDTPLTTKYYWHLKRDGTNTYHQVGEGQIFGLDSLAIGRYQAKCVLVLQERTTNDVDAATYEFEEVVTFVVRSATTISAWVTNPTDYAQFTEGDQVEVVGYARRDINLSMVRLNSLEALAFEQDALDNDSKDMKSRSDIEAMDTAFVAPSRDILAYDPGQVSPNSAEVWRDEWMVNNTYHSTIIARNTTVLVREFPIGYHTLTYQIFDGDLYRSASASVHFWVNPNGVPTAPRLYPFISPAMSVDGSAFVDWNTSRTPDPTAHVDEYEVRLMNNPVYPVETTFQTHLVLGNESFKFLRNLPSSNESYNYGYQHWFQVRAHDSNGNYSLWSNVEGLEVNYAPKNLYSRGIFDVNEARVDWRLAGTSDIEAMISALGVGNSPTNGMGSGIGFGPPGAFGLDNESISKIGVGVNLYQHQPFTMVFKGKYGVLDETVDNNDPLSIDPDGPDAFVTVRVFSSLDGLLLEDTIEHLGGSSQGFNITLDQISNYRQSMFGTRRGLSEGNHTIQTILTDLRGADSRLPALMLGIKPYHPSMRQGSSIPWSNLMSDDLHDVSGDERSDTGFFLFTWSEPTLNPYMEGDLNDKIQYYEIEVNKTYLNETERKVVRQYDAGFSGHYFVNNTIIMSDPFLYETLNLSGIDVGSFDFFSSLLKTGNFTFRVRLMDIDGHLSSWSAPVRMTSAPEGYEHLFPVLLREDNPPPNPVLSSPMFIANETERPTYHVEVTSSLVLNGSLSSDLNGDALRFQWSFDGEVVSSFDENKSVWVVYPESIGDDVNPSANETDLSDGVDDYGDWGKHSITMTVYDGVSAVSVTFDVVIIPLNIEPTASGVYVGGGHESGFDGYQTAGHQFIYDFETLNLYPTGLRHLDHDLKPQNVTVSYKAFNATGNESRLLGTKYVLAQYFRSRGAAYNYTLTDETSQRWLEVSPVLPVGVWDIQVNITDGAVTETKWVRVEVVENQIPSDLYLGLVDDPLYGVGDQNSLPSNGTGVFVLPNQPVAVVFDFTDDQSLASATVDLVDSIEGRLFQGQFGTYPSAVFTKNQGFYFTESGEHKLTLTVSDKYGKTASIKITVYVPTMTVASSMSQAVVVNEISGQQVGYPNYGMTNRSEFVNAPLRKITAENAQNQQPTSYVAGQTISLGSETIENANFIRVWFRLGTGSRVNDELIIQDPANSRVWHVRQVETGNSWTYEVKSGSSSWTVIRPAHWGVEPSQMSSVVGSFGPSPDLVYVWVPGDTVEFTWVTDGSDDSDATGLLGYSVEYIEGVGDRGPPVMVPGNVDTDDFLADLVDENGEPTSMTAMLVVKAWNWFKESWASDTLPQARGPTINPVITIEIGSNTPGCSFLSWRGMEFSLTISYAIFTTDFRVELGMSYNLLASPLAASPIANYIDELTVGGSGVIDLRIYPFMLREISATFFLQAVKYIGLDEMLLLVDQSGSASRAAAKANQAMKKAIGVGLPDLVTLTATVQVTIGWHVQKGYFFETMFEIRIEADIPVGYPMVSISLYAFGRITAGWGQLIGWGLGLDIGAGFGVEVGMDMGFLGDITLFEWSKEATYHWGTGYLE